MHGSPLHRRSGNGFGNGGMVRIRQERRLFVRPRAPFQIDRCGAHFLFREVLDERPESSVNM